MAGGDDSGGGGIIIFTLWYIFIAVNYMMGWLPLKEPPQEPGKEPPVVPRPLPHEPQPATRIS